MMVKKGFDWANTLRLGGVPVGKMVLLLVFMGFPGKFIPRVIRSILARVLKPGTIPVKFTKKVDMWTQILGTLAGFGAAYGFENWKGLRKLLGDTGVDILAGGTFGGALDAGWQRTGLINRDLTNILSGKPAEKIVEIVEKIKGGSSLGAFPEAASTAWAPSKREEEYIVGPDKEAQAEVPKEFRPEEVKDPVQRTEEILAEKSKI